MCFCFPRATTVTRCCLSTTGPKPAWLLVANWTFLSRRPRRASVPGNVSRTWTVGPQRPRAPKRTWTPCTRTASGEGGNKMHVLTLEGRSVFKAVTNYLCIVYNKSRVNKIWLWDLWSTNRHDLWMHFTSLHGKLWHDFHLINSRSGWI